LRLQCFDPSTASASATSKAPIRHCIPDFFQQARFRRHHAATDLSRVRCTQPESTPCTRRETTCRGAFILRRVSRPSRTAFDLPLNWRRPTRTSSEGSHEAYMQLDR
jgi:hypothetical protein